MGNSIISNSILIIFFLLIIFLFLSGCSSGPGVGNINYNFKQGIAEMQMRFLENAPPERLYPNSEFKMILELDNQLAYDAKNVRVKIIGLNEKYFSMSLTEPGAELLAGRSMINPGGDKAIWDFDGRTKELFLNAEDLVNNFFVKVNYDSNLEFSDTFCLNTNLYEAYDSGCKVESQKSYGGQGAPLAVNFIEEIISPGAEGGVEFRLYLQNQGRGQVGKINLGSANLGGEPLECNFKGLEWNKKSFDFISDDQEAVIICKKKFREETNSYMTTLNVELIYNYEFWEQRQLLLVR